MEDRLRRDIYLLTSAMKNDRATTWEWVLSKRAIAILKKIRLVTDF
jgi:hypothetical protein